MSLLRKVTISLGTDTWTRYPHRGVLPDWRVRLSEVSEVRVQREEMGRGGPERLGRRQEVPRQGRPGRRHTGKGGGQVQWEAGCREAHTCQREHRRRRIRGEGWAVSTEGGGAAWTFVGTGEAGFARRGFEIKGTRGKQSG